MPERQLLAIPLPHGRSGTTASLTVYFSPRLRASGPLSDYPEWRNWAGTVDGWFGTGTVRVVVNDVPVPFTRVGVMAEPAVWSAVFSLDTPVRGYRPTAWDVHAEEGLVARSDFSDAILDYYAATAVAYPTTPPPGTIAAPAPDQDPELAPVLGVSGADVMTSDAAAETAAYVAPMEGDRIEEAAEARWDFHQYVSILGHHPQLLRSLGLAVDLELDLAGVKGPDGTPIVDDLERVVVAVDGYHAPPADRWFAPFLMHTTKDFWAHPNAGDFRELTDGFVQFNGFPAELGTSDQHAFLSILDLDSAADKLRGLDGRLAAVGGSGSLPSLRTRAMTLVRPDLVNAYRIRTERQAAIEVGIESNRGVLAPSDLVPVELFAEDVEIGHRIDVLDAADGAWRGLFDRRTDDAGYRFPTDPKLDRVPAKDEGWETLMLVTELQESGPPDAPNPDTNETWVPTALRRIDDQLFRWDGWSGAVRRPGRAATGDGELLDPDDLADAPEAGDPVQFATSYRSVPGTLPRLRFTHTYTMRARSVDLSGVSRSLAHPAPDTALAGPETFGRLDPVAAPHIVRTSPRPIPGVGDSTTTVVLLSDHDIDDKFVAGQVRLLFPGEVGQDLVELHGLPAGGVDPASYDLLEALGAGSPDDHWQTDEATGEAFAAEPGRLPVRYLADPMIDRVRAYHFAAGEEVHTRSVGEWPALRSSRVEVVAGPRSIVADPDGDTDIRISVGKADIDAVALSHALPTGGHEQFGLWYRVADTDRPDGFGELIDAGAHWMFSPSTSLRLIHAVRRPLEVPRLVDGLTVERGEHSTAVELTGTIGVDRRSTGRVTMVAQWTDLVDDLRAPGPEPRDGGASLADFGLERSSSSDDQTYEFAGRRAELGDTRRHAATVDLEAFSWFSDFFAEETSVVLRRTPVEIDRRGVAAGSVKVTTADGVVATEWVDFTVDSDAGTLAVLEGKILQFGHTATVRFVPLPVSRRSDEAGELFEVVFPSTAAPPPPVVAEVVPAFRRSREDRSDGELVDQTVSHDGGVVRVYFERPWNVSGDGECVAVLVASDPDDAATATCVARDPIVNGSTTQIDARSFPLATSIVDDADGAHQLALHDARYDPSSRRWFTDIAVATDMYRPFLRLTIARYQPDAIAGQHRSTSVTLEPIRLGASRSIAVSGNGAAVDVVVTGPEHLGMTDDSATSAVAVNELVVVLQTADEAIADADLRWVDDVSTVSLVRTADAPPTWSGHVDIVSTGAPSRLVIEEREPAYSGATGVDAPDMVVYTDVVELPAL